MSVSRAIVQRRKPLFLELNAHLLRCRIAIHASGVLRAGDGCAGRPDGAVAVHGGNAALQIIRHAFDAPALQNGTGNAGRDLLFPVCKIYPAIERPLFRIVRHKLRLL